MDTSERSDGLTKREFLRKIVVGGAVIFVAGGGYVRPELQTLLGPQVAHATGSHRDNEEVWQENRLRDWHRKKRFFGRWGRSPKEDLTS